MFVDIVVQVSANIRTEELFVLVLNHIMNLGHPESYNYEIKVLKNNLCKVKKSMNSIWFYDKKQFIKQPFKIIAIKKQHICLHTKIYLENYILKNRKHCSFLQGNQLIYFQS